MLRIPLVNNIEAALAPNDLVVRTPLLYTSPYFHQKISLVFQAKNSGTHICPIGFLSIAIHDTPLGKVKRRYLNLNAVTRKDLDVVHSHFPGQKTENRMPVFKTDPELRVRQRVCDFAV